MNELRKGLGSLVEVEYRGVENEIRMHVLRKEDIGKVLRYLRDHTESDVKVLLGISGVDYVSGVLLVYELLSIRKNVRVSVDCWLENSDLSVETVSEIYESGVWAEREVYDMFGVEFVGHKDLRRLLTDYGFKGNVLRKSYVVGENNVRYDEEKKGVRYV